ncbi:efflux RND transporter permease subunit [Henriciella sp.]|uniref:efflux RND transporter permease subunit n=1 Tax=Henriciella sp. TaxID=1968823 RepID=UPI0026360FEF|nr:efflux RND transporter permease subunit [Henriciella sp.]
MTKIIEGILANRVAANLLMVFIVISGIASLSALNVRVFPPIETGQISVSVPYPGATPEDVETSIVRPIEERLEGLEGVDKVTSLAASSVGSVIVDIPESEDMSEMLDEVKNEIGRITVFPQAAEAPQISEIEPDELVTQIVLYGDVERRVLKRAADRVRRELAGKDGLSLVEIGGVPDYLINIAIPEQELRARDLSLTAVANVISQQSLDLSAGEIEDDRQLLRVRAVGERRSGVEFGNIVVGAGENGSPIYLRDIADIDDGLAEDPIKAVYDGKPASIVTVYRVGSEKTLGNAEIVRKYLDTEIRSALPAGISYDLWRDESVNLSSRINLLVRNAVLGLCLVTLLLLLFLDLRIAFWVALGVGVSFIGAFFPMFLFGITINQLSLFGFILAIGIIVDDAIVVGENIHANWRKGYEQMEAARLGATRVARPVLFSVSTTITAFVPILLVPGLFGQFLGQVSAVVIILLFLSLVESFFVLPRHLSHLTNKPPGRWSPRRLADPVRDRVAAQLRRFTEGPLRKVMNFVVVRPLMIILIGVGIFFAAQSLTASGYVKFIFFPAVEGDYVTAELELSEGTSQAQTERFAKQIAATAETAGGEVSTDKDALAGVLYQIGSPLASNDGNPAAAPGGGASGNRAFIVAQLQEASTRDFSAGEFERAWRQAVGQIPGAEKLTFTSDLVSPGAPIQLQVSARTDEATREAVLELRRELEAQPGVYDVRDDRFRTTEEVQIRLKPLARNYGVTQNDIAREVRAAFFGAEAVRIQRDREEIPVRVRLPEDERESLETLKRLRVKVGEGYVPMHNLAELTIAPAPAAINRVNGRRIYSLNAFVDEDVTTADIVSNHMFNTVLPRLQEDYEGLSMRVSGDQEDQAEAQPVLARNFFLAMIVIYSLLALNFRSYSQPLVIMAAIPFGFVGALIGHGIMGADLTLLSFFGIIGLSGVIINTSLMVTDFLNERLESGESPASAVTEAMLDRFRAIMLTTLTTFLGVTPIILETSLQAQFLIPTAISLGFGILFGTSMLIFLLPAFLMIHLKIFGVPKPDRVEVNREVSPG